MTLVNELAQQTVLAENGQLPDRLDHPDAPFWDTSGDGFLTPIDLLFVINAVNRQPTPQSCERHDPRLPDTLAEWRQFASELHTTVRVVVEVDTGASRDAVIASLPETDFAFIRKMLSSTAFVGEATGAGLEALVDNPAVTRIRCDFVLILHV